MMDNVAAPTTRILVVEDEAIVAYDIRNRLESLGYAVVGIAHDHTSALRLAEQERPALVLMDIRLGDALDGIDAAETIREQFGIPSVYLTAYADEPTLQRAKITEPYGYILKPFGDRELHAAIEVALYRHRADRALRESEERLGLAVRAADLGLWDWNIETGEVTFNAHWGWMLGYSPAELPATFDDWLVLIHDDDRRPFREAMDAHRSGQLPYFEVEQRVQAKSGQWCVMLTRGRIVRRSRRGEPLRATGTSLDITDRKYARQLLEMQRDLAVTLSSTTDLTEAMERVIDTVMQIEDVDAAGVYLHDEDAGTLRLRCHRGISPDFVEALEFISMQSVSGVRLMSGSPYYWTLDDLVEYREPVEAEGLMDLAGIPIPHEGDVIGSLHAASRGPAGIRPLARCGLETIAVSLGGALARIRSAGALRTSEATLRGVFEAAPIAVGLVVDEALEWVNPGFARITGYSIDELEGRSEAVLYADSGAYQRVREQLIASGTQQGTAATEVQWRRRDGTVLDVLLSESIIGAEPDCSRRVVTAMDITEQRQAQIAQTRLREQLHQTQKMEAVGNLAAGIAHDFNNLLTAISGHAELAKETLQPDHPAYASLDVVEKAVAGATGATSSLLAFTRKTVTRKVPLDLGALVDDSLKLYRRILPASISLDGNIDPDEPVWVDGDPGQLQQVLMNLVTNGRDAMPQGGRLSVAVQGAGSRAQAELIVTDTGCGMSREVTARMFEPFFTTKPVGRGSGLGLPISRGIIEDHNGRIEVVSSAGAGTRVEITLPRCRPPSAPEGDAKGVGGSVDGQGRRILLAEDDEHVRAIMKSALSSSGYAVVTASDGEQVLDVFDQQGSTLALMVLDLDLPGVDGLTCLKQIHARRNDLPIILTTGNLDRWADSDEAPRGVLFPKPFRMSELRAKVSEVLGGGDAGGDSGDFGY